MIPDAEHQVSQLQNGKIDFSDQTTGPTGDFATNWKYTNGGDQPRQLAGNQWNAEGAAGANYTGATSPTNYGPTPTPTPAALLKFIDSSADENAAQRGWVELPDCTGAAGEVKLFLGKENATSATCKSAKWDAAPVAPVKE